MFSQQTNAMFQNECRIHDFWLYIGSETVVDMEGCVRSIQSPVSFIQTRANRKLRLDSNGFFVRMCY